AEIVLIGSFKRNFAVEPPITIWNFINGSFTGWQSNARESDFLVVFQVEHHVLNTRFTVTAEGIEGAGVPGDLIRLAGRHGEIDRGRGWFFNRRIVCWRLNNWR